MEPVQENILRGLTELKADFYEMNQGVNAYRPNVVSSIFKCVQTIVENGGTEGLVLTKFSDTIEKRRRWFG